MDLIKSLALVVTMIGCWSGGVEGTYFEAGNSYEVSPFLQPPPYRYGTYYGEYQQQRIPVNNKPKQIPATVPVSPVFEVEVMKAMAQLEEQKTVTLYIVPQSSLHVVPHALQKVPVGFPQYLQKFQGSLPLTGPITLASPGHIPAVEVPLEKPLVLGVAQQEVLAPAGFTVLFQGPRGNPLTYPLVTGALLAPVPVGTIISPDTPVVLTTLYAVPNLPSLPSAVQILAEFKQPQQQPGKNKQQQQQFIVSGPRPVSARPVPISPVPVNTFRPVPASQSGTFVESYPLSPVPVGQSFRPTFQDLSPPNTYYPIKQQVPARPGSFVALPFGQPSAAPITVPQSPAPPSRNPSPSRPFTNSKESPYLSQLREDSLRRQIQDLQQQLSQIQSSRLE